MNPKKLEESFRKRKKYFDKYINNIKINTNADFFTIVNTTLIRNPGNSNFPKYFFLEKYFGKNILLEFIKSTVRFYSTQSLYFVSYLISYLLYKLFYNHHQVDHINSIGIDISLLTDNIIKENEFKDPYFSGLYDVLNKYNKPYVYLPRMYGVNKNPFKLIKLFKIINQTKLHALFEYELLSFKDFTSLYLLILMYPFKTLRLLQTKNLEEDTLFNHELIIDIKHISFDTFSRYFYGKNIAKTTFIKKIFSWSEFQSTERSFNYGIRRNNNTIRLYGCQFFLNYETYFNSYVDDIDFTQLSSFHCILVNGKHFLLNRKLVEYKLGVSLRYRNLFLYNKIQTGKNILLLGAYSESDTKYMLSCMSCFGTFFFKNHPAVNVNNLNPLPHNIQIVHENIYALFEQASIVVSTASGTLVEAISCGVSVIIIASQNNLTHNPLDTYGKGQIWDIAFTENDVQIMYNNLIEYRKNNIDEIYKISSWYKENYFIEPNEQNIIKAFELDKE